MRHKNSNVVRIVQQDVVDDDEDEFVESNKESADTLIPLGHNLDETRLSVIIKKEPVDVTDEGQVYAEEQLSSRPFPTDKADNVLHTMYTGPTSSLVNSDSNESNVQHAFQPVHTVKTENLLHTQYTESTSSLAKSDSNVCFQPVPTDKTVNHLPTNYTESTSSLTEFDSNESSALLSSQPVVTVKVENQLHTEYMEPTSSLTTPDSNENNVAPKPKRKKKRRNKDKIHPCTICERMFSFKQDLQRHIESHLGIKRYECNTCGKKFSRGHTLKRHVKTHENKTVGSFPCKLCSKVFTYKHSYNKHMTSHDLGQEDEISMNCNIKIENPDDEYENVSREIAKSAICKEILKTDFVPAEDGSWPCDICGETVADQKSLINHRSTHFEVRRHKCIHCQRSYIHKKDLNRHLKSHTELKPHVCAVCGKSYMRTNDLKEHLYTHMVNGKVVADNISETTAKEIETYLGGEKLGPFICTVCGKTLSTPKSFKKHCARHTEEPKLKCPQCDKSYIHRNEFNLHLKTHSGIQYVCPVCGKAFVTQYVLLRHLKNHRKRDNVLTDIQNVHIFKNIKFRGRWMCRKCGKTFLRNIDLKRHEMVHPQLTVFNCDICQRKFTLHQHFMRHIELHEKNQGQNHGNGEQSKHECEKCGKMYIFQDDLKRHMKCHMERKLHVCEICNKSFTRKHGLKRHKDEIHRDFDNSQSFPCSKCTKVYATEHSLKNHIRRHDLMANKMHACKVCLTSFSTNSHLRRHLEKQVCTKETPFQKCEECGKCMRSGPEVHKKVCSGQIFKCEECGKVLGSMRHLLNHQKLHSGQKDMQCDVCQRLFVSKKSLRQHKKISHEEEKVQCKICSKLYSSNELKKHMYYVHSNEYKSMCDVCGKKFKGDHHVNLHMRIHTGEKPYSCEICSKSFSFKSSYRRHALVHQDARPYVCETCGKTFKFISNLKAHINIHVFGQMLNCNLCDKTFTCESYLNRHISKTHIVKIETTFPGEFYS